MPEHWERYASLRILIRNECCNYDKPRTCCVMFGSECEIIAPTDCRDHWRSPMSKHPHRVPMPGPFTITNKKGLRKALEAVERAQEIQEESGRGRCSWFDKAIWPILPGHLLDEYRTLTGKGDDDGKEEGTLDRHERAIERADLDRDDTPARRLPR